jgi:16S rRNA (adenine1518-N6/adenine1519-N6)-dimethyltransferase
MAYFRNEGTGSPRLRMSKLRGQHFLSDKNVVRKIVASAELSSEDDVLEVGPGLGVMTREIFPQVRSMVAVELDPLFVRELNKDFSDARGLRIVEGDILKMRAADLGFRNLEYKLVSNLPYNISSAFLKKFLLEPPVPGRIVVMLQKEVSERILFSSAKDQRPKIGNQSLLGLMCNIYAACSPVCRVPAGAFAPPPKVDSMVIRLDPYSPEEFSAKWGVGREAGEDILAFAAKFFAQPRKKMAGLLPKPLADRLRAALSGMGQSPDSRPAALELHDWVELWKKTR